MSKLLIFLAKHIGSNYSLDSKVQFETILSSRKIEKLAKKVNQMNVLEDYKAFKGVKYITQAGCVEVRT